MSDPKTTTQNQAKAPITTTQPGEQRGHEKTAEGQADTTGTRPGMPQRNEQGKPTGQHESTPNQAGPNPGPGVTSQGRRVDENTSAYGNEQDTDRKQPTATHDTDPKDRPRDQDKDREEPLKGHKVGDDKPEHTTKAKA